MNKTKKITMLGMLSAIAYIVMVFLRVPVVEWLQYDPKDIIITIGGFIAGPVSAVLISFVVSFIEMFTVSDTGFIGFIMNMLASCAFACTASVLYKKKHTIKGAVLGLALGVILTTIIMLLWNYLITPIYMGYPREAVAAMLVPVFLPFNLIKCTLNMAFTLLIYKPIITALRKAGLVEIAQSNNSSKNKKPIGIYLLSLLLIATCVLSVLALNGKI